MPNCWGLTGIEPSVIAMLIFVPKNEAENKSAKCLKAEFSEQILKAFYDAMDYIFREGFGTGSKADEQISSGLASLLFGDE